MLQAKVIQGHKVKGIFLSCTGGSISWLCIVKAHLKTTLILYVKPPWLLKCKINSELVGASLDSIYIQNSLVALSFQP